MPPAQALLNPYTVRVDVGTISSTNPGIADTSDFVRLSFRWVTTEGRQIQFATAIANMCSEPPTEGGLLRYSRFSSAVARSAPRRSFATMRPFRSIKKLAGNADTL